MKLRLFPTLLLLASLILVPMASANHHEEAEKVFELRIYHPHEGKIEALLTRFRDHTCGIFERLGIENVGYWVETEPAEGAEPKLYYVIAHPSRQAAKDAWAKFMVDPEWKAAYADSIKDGRLVVKVDSIFMAPTDFSAIK
ncbi:NIPSNAP family protein [Synoicihabitans lomoniglobus]|uniref:NIPSNAP family protein n=1 Tax=Synoicihabitans lomoniglobus TaxID=2909285 RepID=A0AAF0A0W9_9BACT|nr:NIPSNAP family protein [Opitutaceae bacterium LMO-M01]WED65323.1 NIPSNAP family protein [Opitutaceae bacterium LMO-M01]